MRFCVLLALLVATFVASCASFASAERNALSGPTDENTNVRHLREYDDDDDDVFEERGLPPLNAAVAHSANVANKAQLATKAGEAVKSSKFKKVIAWMAAALGFTSLGAFITYYYNRTKQSNVVSTAKVSTGPKED